MVALEFAPVGSVLMCSAAGIAAAAAVAMIEHQQAMMLMLLANYFYPVPPSPPKMTTNNHQFFQMVSFVLVPVDNFDTVDMDYSIVGSEEKQTRFIFCVYFMRLPPFDYTLL